MRMTITLEDSDRKLPLNVRRVKALKIALQTAIFAHMIEGTDEVFVSGVPFKVGTDPEHFSCRVEEDGERLVVYPPVYRGVEIKFTCLVTALRLLEALQQTHRGIGTLEARVAELEAEVARRIELHSKDQEEARVTIENLKAQLRDARRQAAGGQPA